VSETISGIKRISDANEDAARRSLAPHLEAGEEVVVFTAIRERGGPWSTLMGPRIEVTPASVELPELCAFAVTSRRVLVVSHEIGGTDDSAMLMSHPLGEVQSLRMGRVRGAKEVRWSAGGSEYAVSTNGRFVKQVAQALQAPQQPSES
jgi:hypothetical protein